MAERNSIILFFPLLSYWMMGGMGHAHGLRPGFAPPYPRELLPPSDLPLLRARYRCGTLPPRVHGTLLLVLGLGI